VIQKYHMENITIFKASKSKHILGSWNYSTLNILSKYNLFTLISKVFAPIIAQQENVDTLRREMSAGLN